jgi:hypothetical protein
MEKFVEITYLYDFYQTLLTEKQRELISSYYFDDLSLGELALQHEISRQSVFDTIKKAQQKLLDLEQKLQLWSKYQKQEKIIKHMKELMQELTSNDLQANQPKEVKDACLEKMNCLIDRLMSEM